MIKNDLIINSMAHGYSVENIAENRGIDVADARKVLTSMSFKQFLEEANITPPSGQTIGPSANNTQPSAQPGTQTPAPNGKPMWAGKGAPVQTGMTVGLKGPDGLPVPGEVAQVDTSSKGVKVKNPTTGQTEWQNMDALEPFLAQGQAGGLPAQQPNQQATAEDAQLRRLKELAGVAENCSAGATGAGGIAVANTSMGSMNRRQPTEETALKKEYTPKGPPKTIIGDTKPNQATGQLSANLAATGMKSAGRANNGFKR